MSDKKIRIDPSPEETDRDERPTIEIVQEQDGDENPVVEIVQDEAEGSTLAERVKALEAERDRLTDAWLRTRADFDNFRKRTEREKSEFRAHAVEAVVLQLLPVVDNFDRALESLPPDAPRGFAEGVGLIHKQLVDSLGRQGVSAISTAGETFDPRLHEAVETEERSDVPHHQILCERQKGYVLGKKVIRPARVKVAVRPEQDAAADEDASEASTT